jgi:UDP-N-acetylmuramate--alanine ligase
VASDSHTASDSPSRATGLPEGGPPRFLCGIGGSGMSPLAQVLRHRGEAVRGSDRSFDRGENAPIRRALYDQGIAVHPQDGSGVPGSGEVVVSSAVEPDNPDVKVALSLDLPIRKRADVLADLFNASDGIAVGGTSGKTTVTGMVGHILVSAGRNPTVINGGIMLNAAGPPFLGNAICGRPSLTVIEADESDGTIALYRPAVAVVTNITLDHKPLEELRTIFGRFAESAARSVVLNLDCPESIGLAVPEAVTFAIDRQEAAFSARDVRTLPDGSSFIICDVPFRLRVPGRHNVANATAAVAACAQFGVPVAEAASALAGFEGIQRRLQILGHSAGTTVIDDFAHNPDKVRATLATLKESEGRVIVVFQPTGFGPTRFLKDGLITAFSDGLGPDDLLLMPEIYYAGGTAVKDISSSFITDAVARRGVPAEFIPTRKDIAGRLVQIAERGDRIVVMGARDNTLTDFGRQLLDALGQG